MKRYDCIVCGSCVVDVLCRPVPLTTPVGPGELLDIDPPLISPGGIAANVGINLCRLGLSVGVLAFVGNDEWGTLIRTRLRSEGVDDAHLLAHAREPTRVTIVAIDGQGQRSLLCGPGASRALDKGVLLERLDVFARARMCLLGYFGHMPNLEPDLPEVLRAIRANGCRTAMDAAPGIASMRLVAPVLPHLDVYVPSYDEARRQTGADDPREILSVFRRHGARGLVGVKLGARGALLSDTPDSLVAIDPVAPPGPVVDTTGAGDAFYAGLIAGLLRGLGTAEAGRLAVAAGAGAVTVIGGAGAVRDGDTLHALAGLPRG